MEEVKITFFKDKKITKNNPSALLEFSTGENMVVTTQYVRDISYYIQKAIYEVIQKKQDRLFQKLQ